MKKVLTKVWALLLTGVLGMAAIFVGACGSLKVDSLAVDGKSFTASYTVGDNVDLSGLKAVATYSDKTTKNLEFKDLEVTFNGTKIEATTDAIAKTAGTKTIKVAFEKAETTFSITVKAKAGEEEMMVGAFEAPENLTERMDRTAAADKSVATSATYESEFYKKDAYDYIVGDDNAFIFVPRIRIITEDGVIALKNFKSDTVISLINEDKSETLLTTEKGENNEVSYKSGETLMVTANVMNNSYQFTAEAQGKFFKLSVLPASNFAFTNPSQKKAQEITVKVVDGFNVYKATDLAVINNRPDNEWGAIKLANNLTDVNPNAVIFQNDIKLLASDVPQSYTYTIKDVPYYKMAEDGQTKELIGTADRTFLNDWKFIYERDIVTDTSFSVYGNYYSLNASSFPLVCSFENKFGEYYGTDSSNSALFHFIGKNASGTGDIDKTKAVVNFDNLDFVLNANIDSTVDEGGNMVYNGGLIGLKMNNSTLNIDNAILKTGFLTLFGEPNSAINANNVKVFDSFQTACFVWGDGTFDVTNSNMQRAGGPLFMIQHVDPSRNSTSQIPRVTVDANTVLKSEVTGNETWFASVGATQQVALIKLLDSFLNMFNKTIIKTDKKGNELLNIIGLIMSDGVDVSSLGNTDVQGRMVYGENILTRLKAENSDNNIVDLTLRTAIAELGGKNLLETQMPIFNIGNSVIAFNPNDKTIYGTDADKLAFATTTQNCVALNQLGMGLLLGLSAAKTV